MSADACKHRIPEEAENGKSAVFARIRHRTGVTFSARVIHPLHPGHASTGLMRYHPALFHSPGCSLVIAITCPVKAFIRIKEPPSVLWREYQPIHSRGHIITRIARRRTPKILRHVRWRIIQAPPFNPHFISLGTGRNFHQAGHGHIGKW